MHGRLQTPSRPWARNAHAANRSVKTMVTLNATDPNLLRCCRSLGAAGFLATVAHAAVTAGGDLWSYTSCNAGFGTALRNGWWIIPPINETHPGGLPELQPQGATGLLYYRADGWTAGKRHRQLGTTWTPPLAAGDWAGRATESSCIRRRRSGSTESAPGIRLKAHFATVFRTTNTRTCSRTWDNSAWWTTHFFRLQAAGANWNRDPNARLQNARATLGQLLHQLAP